MKKYMFYEKRTMKEFWENGLRIEKIYFVGCSVLALFYVFISSCCTLYSTDRLKAGLMFGAVGIYLFFGIPFVCHMMEKSFWIVFEETYVLNNEGRTCYVGGNYKYKRKVLYEEVRYIVTGNVGPYIVPDRTSSKGYHKKFGNYINALSDKKQILFSVRFSEETLEFLQKKCTNAEIVYK